jgi:hypothetical protein
VNGGFADLFRPDGVGFDLQWGGILLYKSLAE